MMKKNSEFIPATPHAHAFHLRQGYGGQVGVHPAIIMFPEYEADLIGKAA